MPPAALFAVLAAALLHASWNLVVKSSNERLLAATAQVVLAGLVFLPVVIWRGLPGPALAFVVASSLVQLGYLFALTTAYDRSDLSFVYPLARGTAPLILAGAGVLGLGGTVDLRGWTALALICGGVMALAFTARSHAGLGWSLLTGALIALYIAIDGTGVRRADDTLAYTATLYLMTGVLLVPMVWVLRGKEAIRIAVRTEWRRHLLAGAASLASYGLLLYASRLAPLSLVAAGRETGVVFATIGGWWFLHEQVTRARVGASILIALGVAALALGR
jgi:drug/metabolite transporter (DMT)-like permease